MPLRGSRNHARFLRPVRSNSTPPPCSGASPYVAGPVSRPRRRAGDLRQTTFSRARRCVPQGESPGRRQFSTEGRARRLAVFPRTLYRHTTMLYRDTTMDDNQPRLSSQTLRVLGALMSSSGNERSGAEICRTTKLATGKPLGGRRPPHTWEAASPLLSHHRTWLEERYRSC